MQNVSEKERRALLEDLAYWLERIDGADLKKLIKIAKLRRKANAILGAETELGVIQQDEAEDYAAAEAGEMVAELEAEDE